MTDDVDVDAMLEAPYKKNDSSFYDNRKSVKERDKSNKYEKSVRSSEKDKQKRDSRSGDHRRSSRSRSKERRLDRDRQRDREREREREREKERERERQRERDRAVRRSRSRSPRSNRYRPPSPVYGSGITRRPPTPPDLRGSSSSSSRRPPVPDRRDLKLPGPERRDYMPFTPRYSPPKNVDVNAEMSPEERDARTVFCMQLARTIRPRDMEEFFSSVGRVRDVRIITDTKTRRSKGIAYIEFWDLESVPLALGLSGQRLLGAPIVCQPTQSEKNRMASAMLATTFGQNKGPMKLYIGSLHFNITEDMLRGIFEPFGKIDSIQLLKDPETNRSRGYGFVTFHNTEDAKRAMEQLNGFELAGRPMKVGHVTEHQPSAAGQSLDSDDLDRQGIDLGTTGRLQLMAKLAEGTGMQLPEVAQQMLNMQQQQQIQQQQQSTATPPIATQCFMLSNMFDPAQEIEPNWDNDIREDVIEECNKHGGVLHIFVDKASPQGNVYVKCPTIAAAVAAVNSLHGRWFSGKIITANYVPVSSYHQLFPDAIHAVTPLIASGSRLHGGF